MLTWSRLQWNKNQKASEEVHDFVANSYRKSNALLTDIVLNYRTVIGFGEKNVKLINKKYVELLKAPMYKKVREANTRGVAFGFS